MENYWDLCDAIDLQILENSHLSHCTWLTSIAMSKVTHHFIQNVMYKETAILTAFNWLSSLLAVVICKVVTKTNKNVDASEMRNQNHIVL